MPAGGQHYEGACISAHASGPPLYGHVGEGAATKGFAGERPAAACMQSGCTFARCPAMLPLCICDACFVLHLCCHVDVHLLERHRDLLLGMLACGV